MAFQEEQDDQLIVEDTEVGGSLASRVNQRAQELRKRTYEWFGVPGLEDVLEVALTPLPLRTVIKVQKRAARERDEATAGLYSLADNLLAATHGFRDARTEEELDVKWTDIATWIDGCPSSPTERQALLFVLGESRIMFLGQEWAEWQRLGGSEIAEEVVGDFSRTG